MNLTGLTFSFHRQYDQYTGGHQKFRDYVAHSLSFNNSKGIFWLQNCSSVMSGLFDAIDKMEYQKDYQPNNADVVFLAGMDWKRYLPLMREDKPKVNLIQHVRHGDPDCPLFEFLQYKAIRICVSEAVKKAIEPYANGPCYTIKMGHEIPDIHSNKENELYILAKKNAQLGNHIAEWARNRGWSVMIHDRLVEKQDVLQGMASARISLVLPNKTEGFFLPGIEAMKLSDWAVVPDCIANQEYCLPGTNSTSCDYEFNSCITAIENAAEELNCAQFSQKKEGGLILVNEYKMRNERLRYHQVLKENIKLT